MINQFVSVRQYQQMQQQTAAKHSYSHNNRRNKGREKQKLSHSHHIHSSTDNNQFFNEKPISSSVSLNGDDKTVFRNQQISDASSLTIKQNSNQFNNTKTESAFRQNKNAQYLQSEKSLDNIKVMYKKIQDFDQQKQKQREAKNFIFRIAKQKREFQGRLLLIKKRQQDRKSMQMRKQKLELLQSQQIQRLKRRNQSQQRWQDNCDRIKQRQLIKSKRQSVNIVNIENLSKEKNSDSPRIKLNKLLQRSKVQQKQHKVIASPAHILGNKYLKDSGRMKRKCRTQSAYYEELNECERKQIERIRQKINLLTLRLKNS